MKFDYTATTGKSFDAAVRSAQEAIAAAGMRVLHIHDVRQTLSEKWYEREPLKIIEFCNAKLAYEALSTDMNISLWLPCRLSVYVKDGKTVISAMRPVFLSQFFPNAELNKKFEWLDTTIRSIVDNTAK